MDPINIDSGVCPFPIGEGWRKFVKGSPPKILKEILEQNAPAWSEALDLPQKIKKGDVYLYLGRAGEPHCAVRIFDGLVDEVLSTTSLWELDPIASKIIDNLVKDLPGYEKFKETKADLVKLSGIESKINACDSNYPELSRSELSFLYELDRNVLHFGQSRDYRLINILAMRDRYSDLATIFDCAKEEVTFLKSEIDENTRVYCGVLDSKDWGLLVNRRNRLMVVGDIIFDNCQNVEKLPDGLQIYGRASFRNCLNLKEIGNYVVFRGSASFAGAAALSDFGMGVEFLGKANFSNCALLRDFPAHVIFTGGIDFSGSAIRSIPAGSLFVETVNFSRTPIREIPRDVEFHEGVDFEASALEYISENVVFRGRADFNSCVYLKEFHPSVKFLGATSFESSGIGSIPQSAQFFDDVDFSSCKNLRLVPHLSRFYGVTRFSHSGIERVENDVKFYGPVMFKSCPNLSTIGEGVSFHGPVYIKNCPVLKKN
jgi:hypothetical protein